MNGTALPCPESTHVKCNETVSKIDSQFKDEMHSLVLLSLSSRNIKADGESLCSSERCLEHECVWLREGEEEIALQC